MTERRVARRRFCQAAVCLPTAAWGLYQLPGLQAAEDGLEIGQHIYKSLKWNMVKLPGNLQQQFESLKEIGYDGVELDSPGEITATQALAASRASGLLIEGIVNSTHWQVRHSDPDPAVRKQARENMSQALRFASDVGAGSVLLVPGKVTDPDTENHQQVWDRSLADLEQLLPLAERLQVLILIENVGNGFCETPQQFAAYVDTLDSPWLGIHFDIGNHIRVSPPAEWIRVLGPRIKKLDVKDRTRQNERTLIGEGQAEWVEVRKALQALGYRGWAAAEVPAGDHAWLSDVLQRMNQVLGPSDGQPSSLG